MLQKEPTMKNNTKAESFRKFLLHMEEFALTKQEEHRNKNILELESFWSGAASAWREAAANMPTYFLELSNTNP